jgi:ribosome biogenesis GTPase
MILETLGYNSSLERFRTENNLGSFDVGRVISEHKERYVIMTEKGECEAEITGNIRFMANSREDFPAVGDWVAVTTYDSDFALIHQIFPRFSIIKRMAAGQTGELQVIAANIDVAFIVQSVDRDFNVNRLERYLAICNSAKVSPIIILTKIDLVTEYQVSGILENIKGRIEDVTVLAMSNESMVGINAIATILKKGATYCMLGSSGAGKSTLINNLSGKAVMLTGTISQSTNKGRHVTSHRELVVLENSAILIDNPGMREVGIGGSGSGLEITFGTIGDYSGNCRFKDCTHTSEIGCSVLEAVENGTINKSSYENYMKMVKERTHLESSLAERHKKDKEFGKFLKDYKKQVKKNRD